MTVADDTWSETGDSGNSTWTTRDKTVPKLGDDWETITFDDEWQRYFFGYDFTPWARKGDSGNSTWTKNT